MGAEDVDAAVAVEGGDLLRVGHAVALQLGGIAREQVELTGEGRLVHQLEGVGRPIAAHRHPDLVEGDARPAADASQAQEQTLEEAVGDVAVLAVAVARVRQEDARIPADVAQRLQVIRDVRAQLAVHRRFAEDARDGMPPARERLAHDGVELGDAEIRVLLRRAPALGEAGVAQAQHVALAGMGQHEAAAAERLVVRVRADNQEAGVLREGRGRQHGRRGAVKVAGRHAHGAFRLRVLTLTTNGHPHRRHSAHQRQRLPHDQSQTERPFVRNSTSTRRAMARRTVRGRFAR